MTDEQKQRAFNILKELHGSGALTDFMHAERIFLRETLKFDADAQTHLMNLIQETLNTGELEQPVDPKWGDNLTKVTGVICVLPKLKIQR